MSFFFAKVHPPLWSHYVDNTMLFQFVSVLLLIGSDAAAATETVNRKRSNLLQHKSTNTNQQHDERYAAYMGLAEEDNVIINRQLQKSMSMSTPANSHHGPKLMVQNIRMSSGMTNLPMLLGHRRRT